MSQQPQVPPSPIAVHFLQMVAVKRIPLPTEKHTEAVKDGVYSLLPNNIDMCLRSRGSQGFTCMGGRGQGEHALLGLLLYKYVGILLPLLAEQPKTHENVILPKAYLGDQWES